MGIKCSSWSHVWRVAQPSAAVQLQAVWSLSRTYVTLASTRLNSKEVPGHLFFLEERRLPPRRACLACTQTFLSARIKRSVNMTSLLRQAHCPEVVGSAGKELGKGSILFPQKK